MNRFSKHIICYILVLCAAVTFSHAQTAKPAAAAPQPALKKAKLVKIEQKSILYYTAKTAGLRYQTNGWNIFYKRIKIIHERKTRFWEYEIGKTKHEKEVKSASYMTSGGPIAPKSYVFGKQYSLYDLHARIGYSKLIAYKANRSGVEVSFNYSAGVSLGILKPYYLILYYHTDNEDVYKTERFSSANGEHFLDPNFIYGYAGFWKKPFSGWRVTPGSSAKMGLNFDWSNYDDKIKALEVGVMLDAYLLKAPIMVNTANHKFFPSVYISVEFGSKK